MKNYRITTTIGILSIIALGVIIFSVRRTKSDKMASRVADEGYETAQDILFPLKGSRMKGAKGF